MTPPRPSGSHQWSVCHGSHKMQCNIPSTAPSTAAEEGTAIHWIAEQMLRWYITQLPLKLPSDFVNQLSPNDVLITQEMYNAADLYVTDILKSIKTGVIIPDLHVEELIDLDIIYPKMKGTADCWLYNKQANHLTVWDLKGGHGLVEVIKNPQLMIYAAGIIDHLGVSDVNITFKIVQPRAYHPLGAVRKWQITSKHLNPLIADISEAAHIAMGDDPQCIAGTHCRYCTARHSCRSLYGTVYNAIDVITDAVPVDLQGAALSNELKLLRRISKLVDYRKTAIEAQVESELKKGGTIPHFMIQKKMGRKRWSNKDTQDQITAVGDMLGIELRKPTELLTPTQAINKGVDEAVINLYSETPITGISVVEDNFELAKEAFKK